MANLAPETSGAPIRVAVVSFDDFNVVASGQCARRHIEQLKRNVDTYAHIGSHDDGDSLGMRSNFTLLRFAETGGADDGLYSQACANGEMRQSALRTREIDQHIGARQSLLDVRGDRHTAC